MFAGLALKRRWQQRRRAAGADTARPNLVMGINVQVCWDKFCNYFEVEPRFAPMAGERFHLDPEQAVGLCDEKQSLGVSPHHPADPRVDLPEELIFKVNYLGGEMRTLALNFSRPGAQVVAQYYTFLRLGQEGFRQVQQECHDVATYTSARLAELGPFRLLTRGDELPVFAFTLHDDVTNYSVFDVSAGLRERGWQMPAYTFPADREDLAALRVVVRNGTSREMADLLLDDVAHLLPRLQRQAAPARGADARGFDHATARRKT
jgi:glutamate/tyrosine decarboxylase-like PLP-dependent enzyme